MVDSTTEYPWGRARVETGRRTDQKGIPQFSEDWGHVQTRPGTFNTGANSWNQSSRPRVSSAARRASISCGLSR